MAPKKSRPDSLFPLKPNLGPVDGAKAAGAIRPALETMVLALAEGGVPSKDAGPAPKPPIGPLEPSRLPKKPALFGYGGGRAGELQAVANGPASSGNINSKTVVNQGKQPRPQQASGPAWEGRPAGGESMRETPRPFIRICPE